MELVMGEPIKCEIKKAAWNEIEHQKMEIIVHSKSQASCDNLLLTAIDKRHVTK